MLLALIMATLTLGLLFSGWLTPTPGKAQQDPPNPTPNQENCAASTNVLSGTPPSVVTNSSVSPTSIIVCYSNAPIMPTTIIAPAYSTNNIYTLAITDTNCNTTTNTENVTYAVSGVFWTNITAAPYTNFPANVTSSFTADADVFVTSSDTNICPSPGLINLATVSWYPITVALGVDGNSANVKSDSASVDKVIKPMDGGCSCGLVSAAIWWFNGEDLTSYGYTMTTVATVSGAPNGATIEWTVTGPTTYTGSGSSITLKGKAESADLNDVTVQATINGTEICKAYLTVMAPHSLKHLPDKDSSVVNNNPKGNGLAYSSVITDQILDKWGNVLPYALPVNEDVDGDGKFSNAQTLSGEANDANHADYTDHPIVGWGFGDEQGWDKKDPGNCYDTIIRYDDGICVPSVFNPRSESVKINHLNGSLYVGSTTVGKGVPIQAIKWQIYQDHARHE